MNSVCSHLCELRNLAQPAQATIACATKPRSLSCARARRCALLCAEMVTNRSDRRQENSRNKNCTESSKLQRTMPPLARNAGFAPPFFLRRRREPERVSASGKRRFVASVTAASVSRGHEPRTRTDTQTACISAVSRTGIPIAVCPSTSISYARLCVA